MFVGQKLEWIEIAKIWQKFYCQTLPKVFDDHSNTLFQLTYFLFHTKPAPKGGRGGRDFLFHY